MWASQLWTTPPNATQALPTTPSSTVPQTPDSEDAYATQRPRIPLRRGFRPVSELFPSSSAPSVSHIRPPTSRAYSRRAESISEHDDATVRRKKRSLVQDDEESRAVERAAGDGECYRGSFTLLMFSGCCADNMSLCSSPQIDAAAAKAGPVGVAIVFYRLDPTPPGHQP